MPSLKVKGGVEEEVSLVYKEPFHYLDIEGNNLSTIEKSIVLPPEVEAPINKGDAVGEAVYKLNGQRIGSVSVIADMTIEEAKYWDYVGKVWKLFCSFT